MTIWRLKLVVKNLFFPYCLFCQYCSVINPSLGFLYHSVSEVIFLSHFPHQHFITSALVCVPGTLIYSLKVKQVASLHSGNNRIREQAFWTALSLNFSRLSRWGFILIKQ